MEIVILDKKICQVEQKLNGLNVVKKALKTFVPTQASKDVLKFSFQRLWDPGDGNRLLAAAFDWVEFLNASRQVLLKLDIGTTAAGPSARFPSRRLLLGTSTKSQSRRFNRGEERIRVLKFP